MANQELSANDIARRAYSYFEARGYEHGHDLEDWTRAENELRRERSGGVAPVTAPRTNTAAKAVRSRAKAK